MIRLAEQMDLSNLNDLIIAQDKVGDTTELRNSVEAEKPNKKYIILYANNKTYVGKPGQTMQEIMTDQDVPSTADMAIINVFNDIAVIEYLQQPTLIQQVTAALKQLNLVKKIYSYQDKMGQNLKREATK